MKIKLIKSDSELLRIFDSVITAPDAWKGWRCVHIHNPDLSIYKVRIESLIETDRRLNIYLKDIDGWLFMTGFENLYIFMSAEDNQNNLAHNILDFLCPDTKDATETKTYDLYAENERFINEIVKKSALYGNFDSMIHSYDHAKRKGAAEQKSSPTSPNPPHVLLVEDDPTTRWMVRKTLKEDCVLRTAQTTGDAFFAYESSSPDIVFLDIGLPDGSGHAVLDWILRNDPGAYVVICSSKNDHENRERALRKGAKDYLVKPLSRESLREHLSLCPRMH